MTEQEMRIAIAESCPNMFWKDKHGEWRFANGDRVHRGDILQDLNAMHEVEKTLTVSQWYVYCEALRQIRLVGEFGPIPTALQRAEAYLRTKGLWK